MKKILKAIALLPPVTALAFCMFLGAALALELDFHGLFQLQYENSDGNTNDEKVNEMFIRRMTLRFTGNISKKAKLILEPEFGKGEPEIKDAYLLFSNPSNEVRIGNHLVPFESEQIVADKSLAFVERRLTASLSPGHNEGVSLLYHFFKKKLYIQAGVWNTNFNVDAETSLINNRLDHPQVFFSNYEERGNNLFINAARLEFGTSSYSRYEGFRHDPKRKSFTQYGASFFKTSASPSEDGPIQGATGFRNASAYEVDFAYNGSSLNFELVYGSRHLEWWQYSFVQLEQVSITSIQKSYSAHLLFAFSQRWGLSARYEYLDYDHQDYLNGKYGQLNDNWVTFGINYDLPKDNTRVQINYIRKEEGWPEDYGGDPVENDSMLIQSTVYF